MHFASGRQPWVEVPADFSEDFDDQLGGEFRGRIVELGWEGHSHGSCLLDPLSLTSR